MLLNVPDRQLISPMVRKITLRFWVSQIFKTNRKEEETLNKNSNLFLRTKPRKLLGGVRPHFSQVIAGVVVVVNFPVPRTQRFDQIEKARLCAH